MKIFNFLKDKSQSKVIFSTVLVLIVLMLSVSVLSFSKGVEAEETACGEVTLVVDKTSCMPGDWIKFSGYLYDHEGVPWETVGNGEGVGVDFINPEGESLGEDYLWTSTDLTGYYDILWQFPVDAPAGPWKFNAGYIGLACKSDNPTSNTVEVTVGEAGEEEDKKEGVSFTLEHYGPYYESKKGERWRAGDLVATLRDEDGGIQNKEVVFFVDQYSDDPIWYPFGTIAYAHYAESVSPALKVHKSNILGFGMTNEDGVATWNYFSNKNINPSDIAAGIRLCRFHLVVPSYKYKIGAAVYDSEGSEVIIKHRKSITVEFPGVARITKVSVYGTEEEIKREEKKVRVMREGEGTKAVYDKDATPPGGIPSVAKCTPYDLLPGDIILLDRNDYVELLWLGGLKMSIKTKPDILKEDTAKVTIGETDLADKWRREVYAVTSHGLFSTVTLGGAGLLISVSHPVPAAIVGGSQIVMWILQWWKGETPFVVNEMESTVLVDFDETKVTFYTVEGTNRLINPKDSSTINITTGHKISVSSDGTFGPVLEFDRSELSDDLIYVLDAIQEGSVETSIEGLTFESRSNPSGSSMQIPLTLNGLEEKVGNMDLTLSYDSSVLEATEVIKGALTTNSIFDYNIPNKGTIKISLADKEGFSGDGSIAYVKFNVIGAEGSSSPLQIVAIAASRAEDYEVQAIPTSDGVFRVLSKEDEGKAPLTPFEPTPTTQVKRDSDGDGVPDEYDYAPNDPNVQTKSDITTPGYGAVFAIGSLLAVAFCLIRRKR